MKIKVRTYPQEVVYLQIASFAAVDHSLKNSKLRGKITVFSLQFHGRH